MHLLTVVGARPQFVKVAAVTRALEERETLTCDAVRHTLVHTGQHYDAAMSDELFRELQLDPPQHHLGVGSGGHGVQTGLMLERLEPILLAEQPDVVLVYGDTNSTVAAALGAAKLHLRVAHVEAGLRSFDRQMPEELNRVVTDHLAADLFCPSQTAVDNLSAEGITVGVRLVGDVMYDALLWQMAQVPPPALPQELVLEPGGYVLATVHRAANTDDPAALAGIVAGLQQVAAAGVDVVFPVHPRTRPRLPTGLSSPRLHLIDPIGHRECLHLAQQARYIITDSGGLQKEALWLGTPCATIRNETEWPETVEQGWNTLVGTDPHRIAVVALSDAPTHAPLPVYGDGSASRQILDTLLP